MANEPPHTPNNTALSPDWDENWRSILPVLELSSEARPPVTWLAMLDPIGVGGATGGPFRGTVAARVNSNCAPAPTAAVWVTPTPNAVDVDAAKHNEV